MKLLWFRSKQTASKTPQDGGGTGPVLIGNQEVPRQPSCEKMRVSAYAQEADYVETGCTESGGNMHLDHSLSETDSSSLSDPVGEENGISFQQHNDSTANHQDHWKRMLALANPMSLSAKSPQSFRFRHILEKYFAGAANKTVLLSATQMEQVVRCINHDYTEILLRNDMDARHDAQLHMHCAQHIFNQFWDAVEIIHRTRMATSATETIFIAVEAYIFPRFVDKIHPLDLVSADLASLAVTWICQLQQQMAPDLGMSSDWITERDSLLQRYLDCAVRYEMRKQLQKALELYSDDEIRVDSENNLVTGLPEQISFMFNQQLAVAAKCLPKEYIANVLAACNEELETMVCDWTLKISADWKAIRSALFCALINDMSRLSDYCEERNEEYFSEREELERRGHALTRDLTEFSLHATHFLCEYIMECLREPEPILTSVGDPVWESPTGYSSVERTLATLEDYFADVQEYLVPGYFFPKVIKTSLDLVLKMYLESFFANTMMEGVNDSATVARQLEQDYLRLVGFFNGEAFDDFHGRGGIYPPEAINNKFRVLQHMAALIEPTNQASDLSLEIQELLAAFGETGGPAVLHLIGLRNQHQSANNTILWLKEIALAKKNLASHKDLDRPKILCTLPDIRNSRPLRKIRPALISEIPRRISSGSIPYVKSTARLLDSPRSFVPGAAVLARMLERPADRQDQDSESSAPLTLNFLSNVGHFPQRHRTDKVKHSIQNPVEQEEAVQEREVSDYTGNTLQDMEGRTLPESMAEF